MCYKCFRPDAHCICSMVRPVDNETGIIILQHPAERNHPFGTARIATLSLASIRMETAWPEFARKEELEESFPKNVGILYPASDAIDLEDCSPANKPEHLIVLDGTWNTARTIYNSYPKLRKLPHYKLTPRAASGYKIRKAPKSEHRSTIEAIWQALTILEPDNTSVHYLIDAFNEMIEQQIKYQKTHPPGPRKRSGKKPPRKPLPTGLSSDFDKLVVGYGEFFRAPKTKEPHQLFYWTAHKPFTGQTFAMSLQPQLQGGYSPNEDEIAWMGLKPEDIFEGASWQEFRHAWEKFAGEDYILATWNQITRRLFEERFPPPKPSLQLKRIYCNILGDACGPLSKIIEERGLEVLNLPLSGRSKPRLSQAVALSHWLREFEAEHQKLVTSQSGFESGQEAGPR